MVTLGALRATYAGIMGRAAVTRVAAAGTGTHTA